MLKALRKKIGIIGFGNMGSAIAERIKSKYRVFVFDKDKGKTKHLTNITVIESIVKLVEHSDVIILAVKPQDFGSLLDSIKKSAGTYKLFISIAAGITTDYIEKVLSNARLIRTMPNILVQIGKGITALSKGKFAMDEDIKLTEELFSFVGNTLVVKENMMNAVTVVSGSGPAYVCYFLEKENLSPDNVKQEKKDKFLDEFIKAAQGVGFDQATQLANQTYDGTISFLKERRVAPSELRKQVTSKGGTTEAALEVLHKGGSLVNAVKAAVKRANELSKS